MVSCGQKDLAVQLLKNSIAKHYCAYIALQRDPLMAPIRTMPEYNPLLSAARDCQQQFLVDSGLNSQ
jgi:hypothetical protein